MNRFSVATQGCENEPWVLCRRTGASYKKLRAKNPLCTTNPTAQRNTCTNIGRVNGLGLETIDSEFDTAGSISLVQ